MAKPRILYIVHCYFNRAGVEQHVRDLRQSISDFFDAYVLIRESASLDLLLPDNSKKSYPAEPRTWLMNRASEPLTEHALTQALGDVSPALIHVQHFAHWPLSMLDKVTSLGVPALISFHDYYAITPHFTMQGAAEPQECFHSAYAKKMFGHDISTVLRERAEALRRPLAAFTARIVPSPYLSAQLSKIFPLDYRVIPHGTTPFERPETRTRRTPLRFGCVGSLLPQKGSEFLLNAYPSFQFPRESCELHIYGGSSTLSIPGVQFHGMYDPPQLPSICREIDVAIIPSLFAETYSLVLSEMWMGGVPVCVSDIGALGERVIHGVNGYKFIPGDAHSLRQGLEWFMNDASWLQWQIPRPRTLSDMAAEYRNLYQSLIT